MRMLLSAATIGAILALGACGNGTNQDPEVLQPTTTSEPITTAGTGSTEGTIDVEALVDEFNQTLVNTDSQAAAELFTDDGVFVDKNGTPRVGKAEIVSYVETVGPDITACERTGPVEVVEPGSYTFPVAFTYKGIDFTEQVVLTLDDEGLIVSHEWNNTTSAPTEMQTSGTVTHDGVATEPPDESAPEASSPSANGTIAPDPDTERCHNEVYALTVSLPTGWEAAEGDAGLRCRLLGPSPLGDNVAEEPLFNGYSIWIRGRSVTERADELVDQLRTGRFGGFGPPPIVDDGPAIAAGLPATRLVTEGGYVFYVIDVEAPLLLAAVPEATAELDELIGSLIVFAMEEATATDIVPATVTTLDAHAGGGSGEIQLQWVAVEGATGYRVFGADSEAGPYSLSVDLDVTTGDVIAAENVINLYADNATYLPPSFAETPSGEPTVITYVELSDPPQRWFTVVAYSPAGESPTSAVACGASFGHDTPDC